MNTANNQSQISERQLDQRLQQLPSSLAPQRNHWPAIEQAITQGKRHSLTEKRDLWKPMAAAATLVLAVSMMWWQTPQEPRRMVPVGDNFALATSEISLVASYEQAFAHALVDVRGFNTSADDWWQTYRSFQQAIESIRRALKASPESPTLLAQLQTTYQQKLQWLAATTRY